MLDLIRNGQTYSLDDGVTCYLRGVEGLGEAPLHRFSQRGPQQHGASDRGYRLDPRLVKLSLELPGNSHADLWSRRDTLLTLLGPAGGPFILRWTLPSGSKRQLDCYYDGDMSYGTAGQVGWLLRTVASIVAPDPTFYDPTAGNTVLNMGGGGSDGQVPTEVPMVVGASTLDVTQAIPYQGNWLSHPHALRITGPITSPIVTNTTTGEKLDFTGTTIAGGDWYELDLRYGQKTVVDKNGVNRIDKLTQDSDLESWHLEARLPGEATHANSIRVQGSAATSTTRVSIVYYNRYLGV